MNPAADSVKFKAFEATWKLDGDHKISLVSSPKGSGKPPIASMQRLVDYHAGHHVPTLTVLEKALAPLIEFEVIETKKNDGPSGDLLGE